MFTTYRYQLQYYEIEYRKLMLMRLLGKYLLFKRKYIESCGQLTADRMFCEPRNRFSKCSLNPRSTRLSRQLSTILSHYNRDGTCMYVDRRMKPSYVLDSINS